MQYGAEVIFDRIGHDAKFDELRAGGNMPYGFA